MKPAQGKIRGYLILEEKLGNNLKRYTKALLLRLAINYKASYVKQTEGIT